MTMAILRAAALSSHLQLAVLLVLLSALPPTRAATPAAGNALASYTDYATQLHADLLANYNKAVPPKSKRTVAYSAAGTDVSLQLRFFKVESVTPAAGQMRTKLWWRTWWSDERLSWDPSQYGGVTELKFHASSYTDPETSDIWLPDLTIYNSLDAFHVSLEPAWASVRHDGTVFWTRPGLVSLMCRFSGLVMFPYDKLSCPLDVGGWQLSGTRRASGVRVSRVSTVWSPCRMAHGPWHGPWGSWGSHRGSRPPSIAAPQTEPCAAASEWKKVVYAPVPR